MSILRDNHLKSIKKYKKVLKITYNVNIKRQPLKQFVHTHIQGLTHISFPSIEILLLYMKMQLLTWRFSLEVVPLIFFLYYMWSGHSRQLFSCSLGIRWQPMPASPTPYTQGWPSYVLTPVLPVVLSYIQEPAGACSYRRGGEEHAPLLVSLVTNGPPDVNFPIIGKFPFLPWSKDCC